MEILKIIQQEKSLREMKESEALISITASISFVCGIYGFETQDDRTLEIFSKEILSVYPEFRDKEVIEAFKMASRGHTGANLELYGKPINLTFILPVLRAYKLYRNKLLAQLRENERLNEPKKVGQCDPETKKKINKNYEDSLKAKFSKWDKNNSNRDKIEELKSKL